MSDRIPSTGGDRYQKLSSYSTSRCYEVQEPHPLPASEEGA
ncbi:hypothetical protein PN478_12275 [Dolichospermum circinale CS-534/05]|nr:hypothetical protein [Dolichospermum circinale]MDB9456311.1 hypothetical protein [Dolichospermum circinale CS-541/06]MDB9462500.1 hypothetical protein [Dolichospermum circinale CS-541/04]MDB9491294.1 hypothetical protein [Dolichospermum circinale CS-534/05]MDB9546531.1 hypothetical protein [Dolichospermum circinale CS-1031]